MIQYFFDIPLFKFSKIKERRLIGKTFTFAHNKRFRICLIPLVSTELQDGIDKLIKLSEMTDVITFWKMQIPTHTSHGITDITILSLVMF